MPLGLVGGAGFVVQLEGLGDGCHRLRNSLSADAIFSSGVSIANPMGKGLDKGKLFGLGEVLEERVRDAEVGGKPAPVSPELFPRFVSLSHDPMGCCSRRSSAKTSKHSLALRVCMCQEAFCVRGKSEWNLVRNSVSVRS